MNFYKCILVIMFIYIYLPKTVGASKKDLYIVETGLESVSPCAVGLLFYVVINNTSEKDYEVELSPKQCCLRSGSNLDCDTIDIIGSCKESILKGTTKALKLVAPVLNPFERHGYCIVYFDSKLINNAHKSKRNTVKIDFDTRLDNKKQSMEIPDNIKKCKNIDQDPLNNCKPVRCEIYYNGRKPFYSEKYKRCLEVPTCFSELESELPGAIYNPISNACIRGRSILKDDIDFIKSLENPKCKNDIFEISDLRLPSVNKSDLEYFTVHNVNNNQYINNDLEPKRPKKLTNLASSFYKYCSSSIIGNRFTIIFLIIVVSVQCCLICALIYYITNKCDYFKRKSNFCNNNTDASLTTPLISSNTETETSDCQYLSGSSNNIDKKNVSYKSCQRGRSNDIKISMSDDILSKCITRRDWIENKYKKSEVAPENSFIYETKNNSYTNVTEHDIDKSKEKDFHKTTSSTRKSSEAKVIFEDERYSEYRNNKKKDRILKNIVQKVDYKCNRGQKKHVKKVCNLSEKEIRCHSYECLNINNTSESNKPNSTDNIKFHEAVNNKKGAISLSSEKGAQAYFSNDSIDDFLSERGMMFLAGDEISKYTFSYTTNHAKPPSPSEISGKSSKNNIVKNMLTSLQGRSKHGISSDPGIATNDNLDVELMFHSTVFTSSNDSDCVKEFRKPHDSRTSL
ncbi:unnamed protein product [Parnassius mnemosyne]|uniref:Uncharacterized protein n=1 Tax=Parnassius mnemosyne TaxID=213953 RepID=A0AAV1LFJ9_9NEOP